MSIGLVVFLILFAALAVLFVAMNIYRRQRILEDRKVEYQKWKRQNVTQWALFRKAQANIDRIKNLCSDKQADMALLLNAVNEEKKEIKETLEILRKETKQAEQDWEGELGRLVERRKTILEKRWMSLNGKKVVYVNQRKEIQTLMGAIEREKVLKDKAYAKWNETKDIMGRIKKEFNKISSTPVSAFEKKHKR